MLGFKKFFSKKSYLKQHQKDRHQKLYYNRYQIMISDYNGNCLYLNIAEGFTFEEACHMALNELNKKMDLSKVPYPLEFHRF